MTRENERETRERERAGERKRGVGGAVGRQSVEVTGPWSRRDVASVGRGGTPMEENGGVAAAG